MVLPLLVVTETCCFCWTIGARTYLVKDLYNAITIEHWGLTSRRVSYFTSGTGIVCPSISRRVWVSCVLLFHYVYGYRVSSYFTTCMGILCPISVRAWVLCVLIFYYVYGYRVFFYLTTCMGIVCPSISLRVWVDRAISIRTFSYDDITVVFNLVHCPTFRRSRARSIPSTIITSQ